MLLLLSELGMVGRRRYKQGEVLDIIGEEEGARASWSTAG